MSKKIARDYLEDISEEGYTITVYASSDRESMWSFLQSVERDFSDKVSSIKEEFDSVTILSMDQETIEDIKELASSKGLQIGR